MFYGVCEFFYINFLCSYNYFYYSMSVFVFFSGAIHGEYCEHKFQCIATVCCKNAHLVLCRFLAMVCYPYCLSNSDDAVP